MKIDEQSLISQPNFGTTQYNLEHISWDTNVYNKLKLAYLNIAKWILGIFASSVILSVLLFIIINFYVFSSIVNLNSFFYSFVFLSLLTDGVYVFLHLPRKKMSYRHVSFDPTKLTILIACFNGEEIIEETITQALKHVPANQIIVVSDASTDNTPAIAKNMGVRVFQNKQNMHKAFSVHIGMRYVKTPYVLLLDDDTFIGNTFIPTSLLDERYSAVAFNVMPVKENTLINELQQFEYQQSMDLGKNVRAGTGAIGNISGAIGLYKTTDLIDQVTLHSGQFAGEDEQRTMLVHLKNSGKGITYTDETVLTKAPSTYKALYKQRTFNWSATVPELFTLYARVLLSPRHHYLLKAEKAYLLYVFITDPLRILFFWALFTRSSHLLVIYGFYLILDILIWLKLRRKQSLMSVLLYPIYSLGLTIFRFIGYFYWVKIKFQYLSKRLYKFAERRHLLLEYSLVFTVLILSWVISTSHFVSDINLLHKISSNHLEDMSTGFNYDNVSAYGTVPTPAAPATPADANYFLIPVERGDTTRAVAYKAVVQYLEQSSNTQALQTGHEKAYMWLSSRIETFNSNQPGLNIKVDKTLIMQALDYEGANK